MKEENCEMNDNYIDNLTIINHTDIIFDKITEGINKPGLFFDLEGGHGKGHTARVLKLLSLISYLEKLDENERTILAYAGLYHDIGRIDDSYNLTHGRMSYDMLLSSGLISNIKLGEEDIKILKFVIENHCIPDKGGKANIINYHIKNIDKALKLYYIFKDADGLDRVRFGDLDERFLRLESSKKLVSAAKYLFYESNVDLF
jgi:hypothetical protein